MNRIKKKCIQNELYKYERIKNKQYKKRTYKTNN